MYPRALTSYLCARRRQAGVEIRSGADPVVERNTLSNNHTGVLVADGGRGKILDNRQPAAPLPLALPLPHPHATPPTPLALRAPPGEGRGVSD